MTNKKRLKNCLEHETKKKVLVKFSMVLLIFLIYFFFSIRYYGFGNGILISFLTWSLFVLCTPIADAGFLLDFPIRFITGIKMIYSEMFVWTLALLSNVFSLLYSSQTYEKNFLLGLLKTILLNPFPYWGIIILSFLGTFLSVYFGDELFDTVKHKERKKYRKHKHKYLLIVVAFLILLIISLYYLLLKNLGVKI